MLCFHTEEEGRLLHQRHAAAFVTQKEQAVSRLQGKELQGFFRQRDGALGADLQFAEEMLPSGRNGQSLPFGGVTHQIIQGYIVEGRQRNAVFHVRNGLSRFPLGKGLPGNANRPGHLLLGQFSALAQRQQVVAKHTIALLFPHYTGIGNGMQPGIPLPYASSRYFLRDCPV